MTDAPAEPGAHSEAAGGTNPDAPPATGAQDAPPASGAQSEAAAGTSTNAPAETATTPDPEPADSLHGCPLDPRAGQRVVHCTRGDYLQLMTALKTDGYDLPVGVTGVDYLTHPGRELPPEITPERFEVVVELLSLTHRRRVRVRCQVPASDPAVPTLFDLWPGTEAHERETYDMFGIRFDGHPDPSRILMPEDWEGHPLRKDYDTGHIPVQFKEAPK
jgi:NADH-quinone oxidoreductase subunit C